MRSHCFVHAEVTLGEVLHVVFLGFLTLDPRYGADPARLDRLGADRRLDRAAPARRASRAADHPIPRRLPGQSVLSDRRVGDRAC